MNTLFKITKNISFFSITGILPQLSNFILLPITTNYLTNTDFSIYGTILAYNMLVQGFKSLGTDILFVNSFFKDKINWKKIWGKYLGVRFVWKHIFFIIQFLVLFFFMALENLGENKIVIILLITLADYLFSVTNDVSSRYYINDKKAGTYLLITIMSVIFGAIANYYFIVFKGYGYLSWFISSFIYSFVSYVFNFYNLYYKLNVIPKFDFNYKFVTDTLKISLPLIPHNYSHFLLHSSDRIMFDRMNVNSENIGNYNIAYMAVNILDRLGDAFGFVINPLVREFFAKNNKDAELKARNYLYYTQVFFILITSSFALLSKEIFSFLFNDIYTENISLIATIMVMGMSYRPMYWATVTKLMFYEKTKIIWRISAISGFINVFLNLIFIPVFGFYAAVITTNLCLLILGFSGFFLKEYKKLQAVNYNESIWLIFIIVLTVFITFAQSLSFEIRITIVIFTNFTSGIIFFWKQGYKKIGK